MLIKWWRQRRAAATAVRQAAAKEKFTAVTEALAKADQERREERAKRRAVEAVYQFDNRRHVPEVKRTPTKVVYVADYVTEAGSSVDREIDSALVDLAVAAVTSAFEALDTGTSDVGGGGDFGGGGASADF